LGKDGAIYFCAAGIGGTPTWTLLSNVKDVKVNVSTSEADATTRANGGFEATVPTLKALSLDFEMIWSPSDLGFQAIQAAFFQTNTQAANIIGIMALDGPNTVGSGAQGPLADMTVTKFEKTEALKDVQRVAVTLKATYSANLPSWKIVA
jgi:hypothetical protein